MASMSDDRLPMQLVFCQIQGTGARGRPMDSWNTIVCRVLANLGVAFSLHIKDRIAWRQLIARVGT